MWGRSVADVQMDLQKAMGLFQQGQHARAAAALRDIDRHAKLGIVKHLLGLCEFELSHVSRAIELVRASIEMEPGNVNYVENLASMLFKAARFEEAIATCDAVLATAPAQEGILYLKAVSLLTLKRFEEAALTYVEVLRLSPRNHVALNEYGVSLASLKRYDDAAAVFNQLINVAPAYAEGYFNFGKMLHELHQLPEARQCFERANALKADYADALFGLGSVIEDQGGLAEATPFLERAAAVSDQVIVHYRLGTVYSAQRKHTAALKAFRRAQEIDASFESLAGMVYLNRSMICDWSGIEAEVAQLVRDIEAGKPSVQPMIMLAATDSLSIHRKSAEIKAKWQDWGADMAALPPLGARQPGKIRIAYVSADFGDHPVSYLTAELFELHDRNKFEVFGISLRARKGAMRERLEKAFDHFVEASELSDSEIALMMREMKIDVAVDLGGYTAGARPGLFALRAAPVQIGYAGFVGTMGADFMDGLIVDKVLIGDADASQFHEKLIVLPSFQVNDRQRPRPQARTSRAAAGLPDQGFVFCCFNEAYKINPDVFGSWMRILGGAPGSVLWLLADDQTARGNLRKAAREAGIDDRRIIFADRVSREDYLARYHLADLFLDTRPYNAGTTASDALWMGLPVLTTPGEALPARMGASLLTAVGLPELIAPTVAAYEAAAVDFARNPAALQALRGRLAATGDGSLLFDSARFTAALEGEFTRLVGVLG